MHALILILIIIVAVNVALVLILWLAGRKEREREERLTRKAASEAIERGVAHVRGEAWVRSHKP